MSDSNLFHMLVLLTVLSGFKIGAAEPVLSDPTRPATYAGKSKNIDYTEKKLTQFKVSQIYISDNTQMAIINSQRVKPGDKLGQAEVLAILPGRVQLLIDGEIKHIRIIPEFKHSSD